MHSEFAPARGCPALLKIALRIACKQSDTCQSHHRNVFGAPSGVDACWLLVQKVRAQKHSVVMGTCLSILCSHGSKIYESEMSDTRSSGELLDVVHPVVLRLSEALLRLTRMSKGRIEVPNERRESQSQRGNQFQQASQLNACVGFDFAEVVMSNKSALMSISLSSALCLRLLASCWIIMCESQDNLV